MVKLCLMCLIGLPASGKTSFSRFVAYKLPTKQVEIVSYDDFIPVREIINGVESWKAKRNVVKEHVDKLIVDNLKCDFLLIILDDNFYYRSMRYDIVKLARKYEVGFCQIYFDVSIQVCMERNGTRSDPVPTCVLLNMNEKLEGLSPDKVPWEKLSLTLINPELNDETFNSVISLVRRALEDPIRQLSLENHKPPPPSIIHIADLALRQVVSTTISFHKDQGYPVSSLSKDLAEYRQQILKMIRSGELLLPDLDLGVIARTNILTLSQYFVETFKPPVYIL